MKYRNQLTEALSEIKEIAEKDEVSTELIDEIKSRKEEISDFKIKVPLMGGFNAGKSTLLNSYLNNNKLPTDIRPETDIAAELKYGTEEKIVAHTKDEETIQFDIDQLGEISAEKFLYLEVFEKNSTLEELDNIVLVDMPGLDSAVELHNKAIMNYLREGVFYVILIDVEQGLQGTVINFLRELNLYELNFAVLLNKNDKKSEEEVSEIVANTEEVIEDLAEKNVFVGSTSALEKEIDDFENILNSMEVDELIEENFYAVVVNLINEVKQQLEMMIDFEKVDTSELDQKIIDIKNQIAKVEEKIEKEKSNIEQKFTSQTEDQILNKVKIELQNNINQLVQAAKVGKDNFSNKVNQIIRPVLTKTAQEEIEIVLQTSFDNIGTDFKKILNVFNNIDLPDRKSSNKEKTLKDIDFNNKRLNRIFKSVIGALGITTSVIAPWLEAIILFLPEIFDILGGLVDKEQQIRDRIQTEIIPQIIHKLRPKIKQSLADTNEEFISQVSKEVEKEKKQLIDTLNKVKEKKRLKEKEAEKRKERLRSDLDKLEEIKTSL